MSPIWLLALAPLVALTLWLLLGRRPRVNVSFLPLWEGAEAKRRRRRSFAPPPVAILFALLALIASVLAAARIQVGSVSRLHVRLIIDRGLSMSARGPHDLRFREAAGEFESALKALYKDADLELSAIPGGQPQQIDLRQLSSVLRTMRPSFIDTRQMLRSAIARESEGSAAALWVISDQAIDIPRGRIVQIAPDAALQDVGIVSLAARQGAPSEVMIRLRNQSSLDAAELVVGSGEVQVRRHIRLPRQGKESNVFVQVPELGEIVDARLEVRDALEADDHAWLVREGSSPRIEARSPIPVEVQRMIAVYQHARRSSEGSTRVLVVSTSGQLPEQSAGVILEHPTQISKPLKPLVAVHAITQHVNWSALAGRLQTGGAPPAGWTPLVWAGAQVLVAARPQPPRQVWIGFDAPRWNATPDFVIFWTNVFDWAGGGGQSLAAHTLNEWTPDWTTSEATENPPLPGLYHRTGDAWRAFNAPAPRMEHSFQSRWRSHLRDLASGPGRVDLTSWLVIAALAFVTLALAAWPARGRADRIRQGRIPDAEMLP